MRHRTMMVDYKIRDWEELLSEGKLKRLGPFSSEGVNNKSPPWRYYRMHGLEIAVWELLFTLSQNIGTQEHEGGEKKKKVN